MADKPNTPAAPAPGTPAPGTPAPASGTPATPPSAGATRGRKPGPAKEYNFAGLSADLLSAPKEVTDEMASQFAPSRARDDMQIAMDTAVKRAYDAWLDEGSPTKWAAMPKLRYHIPPAAVDGFKFLVRRAAEFYGIAIKWGGQQGTQVKDKEGNIVLVFAVRDRRTRDESADATDEDSEE